MNPYGVLAGVLLVLGGMVGSYAFGHHNAAVAGNLKLAQLEQSIQRATLKTLADKAVTEAAHRKAVADLTDAYEAEVSHAKAENDNLHKRISDGTLRLSVPAARTNSVRVSDVYPAATGTDAPARCEFDAALSQRVISVTDDGDDAIRQLNALENYVQHLLQNH